MNPYAIPPMIAAAIVAYFGCMIVFKGRKNKTNIIFGLFTLFAFIWLVDFSLMYASSDPQIALFWARIGFIGVALIPATALHFFMVLFDLDKRYRFEIIAAYLACLPMLLISHTNYVYYGVRLYFWGYYPLAGKYYIYCLALFCIVFMRATWILLRHYKNEPRGNRKQEYKLILIGVAIANLCAIDYIDKFGKIAVYPYGYLCTLLFFVCFILAIQKYNLMNIKLIFTKASIFLLVYSLALGIPLWVGIKTGSLIWSLVLMGILASSAPSLYLLLQRKAETMLLAQQRHYQQVLLQASNVMIREHNLNGLLKFIVSIVQKSIGTKAAVYIEDTKDMCYKLAAIQNYESIILQYQYSKAHELVKCIQRHQMPFESDEMPKDAKAGLVGVQLIIPFIIQDRLLGFMMLGENLNTYSYSREDIDVFKTLSNQAALAIENCLYVEEFKQAQERIFSAEKLASIGGMAEGIAHQLINKLNVFSLNSEITEHKIEGFLEKHGKEVENIPALHGVFNDLNKIAGTQAENVKKTYDMLQGIMNYSTIEVKEQDFSMFALRDIVSPALELLKIKHNVQEFPLKIELGESDGSIYGVKAQLMESLYNILDNAYEALKEKEEQAKAKGESYSPEILLHMSTKDGMKVLEIEDNGAGIKEENKGKVFAPFFSTKSTNKSGAGIGMYIVKRMVEEIHKGKISLESEYGRGTVVRLAVPLKSSVNL